VSAGTTSPVPQGVAGSGAGSDVPGRTGGEDPRPGRGSTVIRPRVVERVAGEVVRELAGAAGTGHRVLGYTIGTPGMESAPTVHATVEGSVATVEVEMAVVYPAPVLEVSRRVRRQVILRVAELTGLDVRRVDISVVTMRVDQPGPARVR
jgi:uncharacterized alkaline shock family protein YloU